VAFSEIHASFFHLSLKKIAVSMTSSPIVADSTPRWDPELQIYVGGVVPGASNEDILNMLEQADGTLRVFGYGSLCWNPGSPETALGNPAVKATLGHAIDYRRIWGQKSTDHRGVPSFPGVVCTLLTTQEVLEIRGKGENGKEKQRLSSSTEGMIYSVPPPLAQQCLQELDFREKGGYAREIITVVEDGTGNYVKALLYRGTPDNPAFSYRLTTDLRYAAAVMSVAHGPSGPNRVYLHQLDEFLINAKHQLQQQHRKEQHDDNGDAVIEDDTYLLADMTTALQKHGIYFFCGSGSNQHGQIVHYFDEDQDFALLTESFVVVATDSDSKAGIVDKPKQLFCGGGHSGLLTQQGNMYLWGWNQHGQCGVEDVSQDTVNVKFTENVSKQESSLIPLLSPLSILVETAAFGFSHTLIIEKKTGKLYAFGDDSHGQVSGRNVAPQNSGNGVIHKVNGCNVFAPMIPSFIDEKESFVAVGAGLFHSAAVTINGELITFGQSKHGQAITDGHKWKPPDGVKLVDVVCGRHHTAMLDDQGRVWTMGENKFGQLGRLNENTNCDNNDVANDGAKLQRLRLKNMDPTPQLVDGPFGKEQASLNNELHRCVDLQSGWSHIVASVEVKESRKNKRTTQIFGWGRSDKGQLGMQEKAIFFPTQLTFAETMNVIDGIACGSDSTHVLLGKDERGTAYEICSVGWNEHGNLGVGTLECTEKDDVFEARTVPGISRIVSPATYSANQSKILLAAGGAHMLAMRS
jgi:alpha-tubulin suppressor-like RCC1 family protein/cation transport regulator ChaC